MPLLLLQELLLPCIFARIPKFYIIPRITHGTPRLCISKQLCHSPCLMVFLERASSTDIELNFAMYSFLCAILHSNQTSAEKARCAPIFDNSYWSLKPMTANVSSSCCSGRTRKWGLALLRAVSKQRWKTILRLK